MSTTTASPVTMAKLLSRHEVAERTTAFRFEKPSNWTFKSGQYLDMTLLDPSEMDAEGNVRSFSIERSSRRHPDGGHPHARYGIQACVEYHAAKLRS